MSEQNPPPATTAAPPPPPPTEPTLELEFATRRAEAVEPLREDRAARACRDLRKMLCEELRHLEGGADPGADADLPTVRSKQHEIAAAALCLSGGGIRSATFALGVLQVLQQRGLVQKFHYLSTVSGGGYIGSYLSACIRRARIAGRNVGAALGDALGNIRHLRDYSNYLTPRRGGMSADVWAVVATYLRNLLLIWLVLFPFLAAVLLLPNLAKSLVFARPYERAHNLGYLMVAFGIGLAALGIGMFYMGWFRPSARQRSDNPRNVADHDDHDTAQFRRRILAPLWVAAYACSLGWAWIDEPQRFRNWPTFFACVATAVVLAAVAWLGAGVLLYLHGRLRRADSAKVLGGVLLAGALAGALAYWALTSLVPDLRPVPDPQHRDALTKLYVAVAPPAALLLVVLFEALVVAFTCSWTFDQDREWSARFAGWVLLTSAAWASFSLVVLFGPDLMTQWSPGRAQVLGLLGSIGGISGLVTIVGGFAAKPDAKGRGPGWGRFARSLLFAVAAICFTVLLVAVIARLSDAIRGTLPRVMRWTFSDATTPDGQLLPPWSQVLIVLALFAGAGALMSWLININRFSLHSMYRNRLVRAYLGAARAHVREQHRFTGFDEKDNFPLYELIDPETGKAQRPLHVINAALNLVGGGDLGWQERKAESFTFTPLHCGSARVGYRRTALFGGRHGMSIGTAMAISGAAANPNMGYHSSPAVTFLLTLFNARLGWWLGNPGDNGKHTFGRAGPSSPRPIFDELLGRTTDTNAWVHVSDGGHFENLGLYEMVQRRCRYIVVCDAGCDPTHAFDDLGNAMRKIRIDLGVPIEISDLAVYPRSSVDRGHYAAVGTIRYDDVDPRPTTGSNNGTLIYIKPALTGSEPTDVANYATACGDFPHESTTDQWFGESQFESYRALGQHAMESLCRDVAPGATIEQLVERIKEVVRVAPVTRPWRMPVDVLVRPAT